MAVKKNIKILSEKTKTEFQEIKKEEESLEEEVEQDELEDGSFTDFSQSSRTAPVLQSSQEPIEQQLENVPSRENKTRTEDTQKNYEKSVYNMPEYGYEKEATTIRTSELRQTGLMLRPEEIRQTRQSAEIQDWHEIQHSRPAQEHEHAVIGAERLDTTRKEPWEQERKYKRKVF